MWAGTIGHDFQPEACPECFGFRAFWSNWRTRSRRSLSALDRSTGFRQAQLDIHSSEIVKEKAMKAYGITKRVIRRRNGKPKGPLDKFVDTARRE
jgi:hypothetical protein